MTKPEATLLPSMRALLKDLAVAILQCTKTCNHGFADDELLLMLEAAEKAIKQHRAQPAPQAIEPDDVAKMVAELRTTGLLRYSPKEIADLIERLARERDEADAVIWHLDNDGIAGGSSEDRWADEARKRHAAFRAKSQCEHEWETLHDGAVGCRKCYCDKLAWEARAAKPKENADG
jgi:hypothetical protein